MPAEDNGDRTDVMLAQNIFNTTHYEPDFDALRSASTTIICAAGAESEGAKGGDMTNDTKMRRAVPPGGAKKRRRSFDWSVVAFVASLCLLAFLYGFASNELNLPPKAFMKRTVSALKAVNLIEDGLPTGMQRIDPDASPTPVVRQLDAAAGRELLLVTGGTNRDIERCPTYGCLATVMDRSGKVLRSWPLPLDALFDGIEQFAGQVKLDNFYPIGLGLLHDGSLVATFHIRNAWPYAVGIARIDRNGRVLWKHIDGAHHWLRVGPDERIYAPIQIRRAMTYAPGTAVRTRPSAIRAVESFPGPT